MLWGLWEKALENKWGYEFKFCTVSTNIQRFLKFIGENLRIPFEILKYQRKESFNKFFLNISKIPQQKSVKLLVISKFHYGEKSHINNLLYRSNMSCCLGLIKIFEIFFLYFSLLNFSERLFLRLRFLQVRSQNHHW